MEFHEKLQELRKQRGLTQEALAQVLYVSRAAVSKWESGRGYPSIDSLKAISNYFSVSIDTLLSGEEVLNIAQEESRQKSDRYCDLLFGLMDCGIILFCVLPLFGEMRDGTVFTVPLFALKVTVSYLKWAYWSIAMGLVLSGVLALALRNFAAAFPVRYGRKISFLIHGLGVLVLILCRQPYAAVYLLLFLTIKAMITVKRP